MFRNMLKRSWLSIRRKIGRTILMTLIFFMMANLVLAAITIKSAVGAQMDYAKASLGGTVTIQADMDSIREDQKTQMEAGADRKEMFGQMVRPQVDVETANAIALYADYVKDYSYEVPASANSNELETVETKSSRGGASGMPNMPGMPDFGNSSSDDSTLDKDITISGVNAYAYISGVKNGSITIKDGEYFDEDGDDKAMISYEFAELNSLNVGDKITLKNVYTEATVELTIIGIYDSSEERANANTIYMNTEAASLFLSDEDYNDGNYDVSDVNYYMLDSDKADEFVERIKADFSQLAENKMKIAVDTSEYDSVSGSIESVGSFATTILIIVIIAAIVIVTLIVTLNVRDRRYEMGVLLSLGAHKRNILAQIATELVIVGTVGFALACISGGVLAKVMGQGIIDSQNQSSQQQAEKNFGRPGAQASSSRSSGNSMPSGANMPEMPSMGGSNMKQQMSAQRKEVELDINATSTDYLLLFVTGYVVIILALILPSVNIMRYQPKQILAGKE